MGILQVLPELSPSLTAGPLMVDFVGFKIVLKCFVKIVFGV